MDLLCRVNSLKVAFILSAKANQKDMKDWKVKMHPSANIFLKLYLDKINGTLPWDAFDQQQQKKKKQNKMFILSSKQFSL